MLSFFTRSRWDERIPIRLQSIEVLNDIAAHDDDERDDDHQLDCYDDIVDFRTFGYANHEQTGKRATHQERGQVE